jgi:hypothetical protein
VTEQPNPRWSSRDWAILITAATGLLVGGINAWQGRGRDATLQVIETNTNSRLTKQDDMLADLRTESADEIKTLRAEVESLKIQRATSQERENPTESDGSAK